MGGTKIIVLQMKELIKTVIFAVIGLILIIALVYFFLPKGDKAEENAIYTPGTYSSQIILQNDTPIDIVVTVSESEILKLDMAELNEEQISLYPLLQPTFNDLSAEVVKNQTVDINLKNDDSVTKQVLLEAIKLAVNKAVDSNSI